MELRKIKMNNVLILSAGRRVELVQAFQREIAVRGLDAKVFAVDLDPQYAAACHVADAYFNAPRVTDPSYISFLIRSCLERSISLVIPTIDTELLALSESRALFEREGIHVVISEPGLIQSCRDKRLTGKLFKSVDVDTPAIFERDRIDFPCFAKPYDGSRSIGARVIESAEALTQIVLDDQKLIFMELVDRKAQEYTVDIYYNRKGELSGLVPRQRIEVRDGEISKGITRRNAVYDYLLPRMQSLKGARGCLALQLFFDEHKMNFFAIEINPRFGGGFPLSFSAGANYPGWLIDEYILGKDITFFDGWESDLMMLRYDAKILVRGTH